MFRLRAQHTFQAAQNKLHTSNPSLIQNYIPAISWGNPVDAPLQSSNQIDGSIHQIAHQQSEIGQTAEQQKSLAKEAQGGKKKKVYIESLAKTVISQGSAPIEKEKKQKKKKKKKKKEKRKKIGSSGVIISRYVFLFKEFFLRFFFARSKRSDSR